MRQDTYLNTLNQIYKILNIKAHPVRFNRAMPNSIYDFSQLLNYNNIRTYTTSLDLFRLKDLIYPICIQHIEGHFDLILNRSGDNILIYNSNRKKQAIVTIDEFNNLYHKTFIFIEKIKCDYRINNLLNDDHKPNNSSGKYYISLIFLLMPILFWKSLFHSRANSILLICNYAGLILMYLKTHDKSRIKIFGHNSKCKKEVCNPPGNSFSQLFNKYGYAFFIINIFWIFFVTISLGNDGYAYMLMYHLVSLPFIIYSLWIQAFYFRQFCQVCLLIILLFFMNILVLNSSIDDFMLTFDLKSTTALFLISYIAILYLNKTEEISYFSRQLIKEKSINKLIVHNKHNLLKLLETDELNLIKFDNSPCPKFGNIHSPKVLNLAIDAACPNCIQAFWHLGCLVLMNNEFCLNIHLKYPSNARNDFYFIELTGACDGMDIDLAYKALLKLAVDEKKIHHFENALSSEEIEIVKSNYKFFETNVIHRFPLVFLNSKVIPNYIGMADIKVAFAQ